MKNKEFWKAIIQVVVSILTAALTALGTTSCMKLRPQKLRPSPLMFDSSLYLITTLRPL